ncbi:MAG: hypothetical protein Q7T18_03070, partial [Sedimentisphaerales bacterium]|nr:hypothetical protein [Sedimentisphaerales bacterium]
MFKSTKHLLVLVVLSFVFTQPLYAIDPCDTTLRLWLKAETLTSSLHQGDAVTQWTDSSSYRTTFQPRAGQNEDPHFGQVFIPGHPIPVPVVQFTINGTNGSMRDRLWQTNNLSPNFDPLDIGNGTSLSAFIVWYPVSTDETFGIQNVFGKRGASSSVYTLGMHTINDTNKGKMNYVTYDAQVEYMNSQATAATKWHVTELSIVENGANDTVTWYDDTSEIATGTMASTGSAAIASRNASTTEAFGIGTHSQPGVGTGESFYGYIAEVIIYARDITGTEKTAIEGYLHNKYFSTSVVSASDATLRLWLKADDLTHTLKPGDAVTQWTDKSSYGTILAPRSGRSEDPHYAEVYIPGNNYPVPAIEFDVDATNRDRLFQTNNLGTGDPLNIGNGSDLTAFVVYWPRFNDATIGVQTIFGKRGETSSVYTMGIINDGTGRLDYITYDAQTLYYNNRSTAAKTWHIGELRVKENGSTDTVTWFDDDTQNVGLRMVDTGSATILGRNASTTEAFGIGGHSQPCCGDGESFDGYVAEIIIFARDVTGDEREAIEKYLHEKYLGAYGSTMVDMATQSTWLKDKFTGPSPAVPFSFTYNGAASSSFLSSWTLTRTCAFLDPNRTQWTMKWINPSVPNGLQVICNVTDYKKYPAAEWLPSFTNLNSSSATYVLSNVQSLNMDMT